MLANLPPALLPLYCELTGFAPFHAIVTAPAFPLQPLGPGGRESSLHLPALRPSPP